jgi:hypothetical protein
MRVLSEADVREIVDAARIRAGKAEQASIDARNKLNTLQSEVREAAARLRKLRPHAFARDDLRRPA